MKIAIIGTGYVGLVSGTCFASLGFSVTCVDKSPHIIDQLNKGILPIFEPGLEVMVKRTTKEKRLFFTTDLEAAVQNAPIIFIAVGTPAAVTGAADLSYVLEAARSIANAATESKIVVIKSTVPVATGQMVKEAMEQVNPDVDFSLVSNPEFLREGSAIKDFLEPDRIVVGLDSPWARETMERLYAPLTAAGYPLLITDSKTSELIKYASNSFLATKVAFINQFADLCEEVGADVQDLARGIGLDHRIGPKFLNASPGYGGSCFPKDTYAIAEQARGLGSPLTIVEAVIQANDARKSSMGPRISCLFKNPQGKKIAVLGLTFKANTDDMRDSASLDILPYLEERGCVLHAYDPEGAANAHKLMPGLVLESDPYDAMVDAHMVLILTEWDEFKNLDLGKVRARLKAPLICDLRNLYNPSHVLGHGLNYVSLGRPPAIMEEWS